MFNFFKSTRTKQRKHATDRRSGGNIPHVRKQPRARVLSGAWRRKRPDAGTKRGSRKRGLFRLLS
jgi:hypothetical protein